MDVRCERCRAQYVFDDAQVTEAGVTVQCTNCGHLFRLKKKALVVTVPVKPGESAEAPVPAASAAAPGGPAPGAAAPSVAAEKREWRVRQANGNVFTFKELTTLQKWIVERKVGRDDEISLSGDQWKRLGNIAELAAFFQVVEAAERGQPQPAAMTPLPMPPGFAGPTGSYPLGYPPGFAPTPPGSTFPVTTPIPLQGGVPPMAGSIQVNVTAPAAPSAAWESQPPAAPRAPPAEPAWAASRGGARPDDDLGAEELRAVKGRGGKQAFLLLLLAVSGGAAAWVLRPDWMAALGLRRAPAPVPVVQVPMTVEVKKAPEPPPVPAPPREEAPPPAPEKGPELLKDPPPRPAPRTAKQLLAEARRLRDRGDLEKALDLYGRVADTAPDNAEALAGRGLCYLDLSQYGPAEASFQAALEEDPSGAEALIGLAETYRYQGKKAEAVSYYQKYLSAHPDGEDAVAARNAIAQLKE